MFVHLHTHSDHSLLDGYGKIKEYVKRVKDLGMPALALTDHNTMTGIYTFIKECEKEGIKGIAGVEINIKPTQVDEKGVASYSDRQMVLKNGSHTHLTLLAKTRKGLENLFKILSLSFKRENLSPQEEPRVDLDILRAYSEGVICLSGCPNSEIAIRLRLGQTEKAYEFAKELKDIYGDNFYIEIMPYKDIMDYKMKDLYLLSKKLDIKAVMTNDVHYLNKEDSTIQEKLMAIGGKNKLSEVSSKKGGLRYCLGEPERYLKSFEEMTSVYDYEKAKELIDNTVDIANSIEGYHLVFDQHLRIQPAIPQGFKDNIEYLKYLINEGFKVKRSHQSKDIQEESIKRLKKEIEVVIANDFVNYFLAVREYCIWADNNGVPRDEGRGSAAGSEIMFLLDVHRTDPIRFDLLFERFISEGRGAVYQIEYEDGTIEECLVSDKKKLKNGKEVYTYQLEEGDIIEED